MQNSIDAQMLCEAVQRCVIICYVKHNNVKWIWYLNTLCYRYVDPVEVGLTDEQLREIPYTHVE